MALILRNLEMPLASGEAAGNGGADANGREPQDEAATRIAQRKQQPCLHFVSAHVGLLIGAVCFERREEALHRRVGLDVAQPTCRADGYRDRHQPPELLAGVLATVIRMMKQRVGLAATSDRYHQHLGVWSRSVGNQSS